MPSHKDILDRIVIASLAEMPRLLDSGTIGAVISANEPDMLAAYKEDGKNPENRVNAIAMLERMKALGLPHYHSAIFELSDADKAALKAKTSAAPEHERKGIRQAETSRHVRETIAAAEELLEKAGDKKLAIHCQAGSDRSGMVSLLLMLHRAGGTENIDQVLADLSSIRPGAQLRVTREDFKDYFGDQYARFEEAIGTYRDAKKVTGELHKAYGESGLQIERSVLGNTFNVAGLADTGARAKVAEHIERYNSAAKRFGLTRYAVIGV